MPCWIDDSFRMDPMALYLQLPHLLQLHPEIRHILPELQQVGFERNLALLVLWRQRRRRSESVALGCQNRWATSNRKKSQIKKKKMTRDICGLIRTLENGQWASRVIRRLLLRYSTERLEDSQKGSRLTSLSILSSILPLSFLFENSK